MIIKATVFEVRDSSRALKRPASLNVRVSLMAQVMKQVAAYIRIDEKPVSGSSGTGLEVGTAFIALHRDDYKQVLALLLELAGVTRRIERTGRFGRSWNGTKFVSDAVRLNLYVVLERVNILMSEHIRNVNEAKIQAIEHPFREDFPANQLNFGHPKPNPKRNDRCYHPD